MKVKVNERTERNRRDWYPSEHTFTTRASQARSACKNAYEGKKGKRKGHCTGKLIFVEGHPAIALCSRGKLRRVVKVTSRQKAREVTREFCAR